MSTLTTEDSSPVKVVQVLADFRFGVPHSGIVFVGKERHRVQVGWSVSGLVGECDCPSGCAAVGDAIRAVEIMAETWKRTQHACVQTLREAQDRPHPNDEPQQLGYRPYDGSVRSVCEADLVPMDVPPWAYDERGIRRPLIEAEIAWGLWCELHRALDSLLRDRVRKEASLRFPVLRYYRASWEPDRGMTYKAFGGNLQAGFDVDR